PPILKVMGRKKKIGFGPKAHVALKVLAKGKNLRGTKLDPFGYMHVRKVERELLAEYEVMIADLSRTLATDGYDRAVDIAALPDMVRGYEDVKLGNIELYKTRLRELGRSHSDV
ncbi:DUF6537 domain-containing protein, partial [Rhodococcus sp. 24CO]|uniref:DUF6537 domain-containing protein n=1 Tax=Rhodococcus sp. 24CO TaxID=3117460 RepID=UPI003D3386EA